MPPYYFLLSYFTLLFTIDQDVFYSKSISHTLRQILYRALYILHPLARQFHPGLALFLHAASVFIACLFICKTQSMSANRIKMHLYRYFQFTQCVKKQQRILYRNTVIRHCMPQKCWRCISGYLEFQGLFFSFIQIIIILSKQTFKRSCMRKFTGSNYRLT